MKSIVIYPPFADPSQPYIALPVLKGYLKAAGHNITTVDLNLAAVHYLSGRDQLKKLAEQVKVRYRQINSRTSLDFSEQLACRQLREALQAMESVLADGNAPAAFFKQEKIFYQYEQYFRASGNMEKIFQAYSSLSFPYQFGFNYAGHFILPWSLSLLRDYIGAGRSLLKDFYADFFARAQWQEINLVGISLTFISQLPECFYLCSLLKQQHPRAFILLGGACISQIMYSAPSAVKSALFDFVDGICIGEGEETLAMLLSLSGDWSSRKSVLAAVPNLITKEPGTQQLVSGPVKVFDISQAPPPDYSDYDLDAYLAPGRLLLYAPTRHCYWRKCSFCTYGFSYAGGHPYQEIPAGEAAAQLALLAREYKTENFYLSCDVLSPRYAEELARALLKQGSKLYWSVDLRIEKYYTPEVCRLLYAAGLRSVALGIESGSDTLLTLINKGTSASRVQEINCNFHNAGIATQWMTFTYHPGESEEDASATLNLLEQEKSAIDLFVAGEFQLVPGSRVMAEPEKFGIRYIYYLKGDEFRLFPLYIRKTPGSSGSRCRERIDARIDRLAELYALSRYPWAGAISTHHTFLYFLHYGQRVFAEHASLKTKLKYGNLRKNRVKPPYCAFSLEKIKDNEDFFYSRVQEAMRPGKGGPTQKEGKGREAELCDEVLASLISRIRPVINRSKILPKKQKRRW